MLTPQLRYDNNEDANMRLGGTIIRLDGAPAFVEGAHGNLQLRIYKLTEAGNQEMENIHSSDVRLDIKSPPLGYCRSGAGYYWIYRNPERKYKQGFHSTHSEYYNPMTGEVKRLGGGFVPFGMGNIYEMISGKYPKVEEAFDLIKKGFKSAAFSRKYCIVKIDHNPDNFILKNGPVSVGLIYQRDGMAVFKSFRNSEIMSLMSKSPLESFGVHVDG